MQDVSMQSKVGAGFCLVMSLKDPTKLQELAGRLQEPATKAHIGAALGSLDYIHYARFLPLFGQGALLIVTEFDGAMSDYVMDFAAVLDDEFSMILSYMKDGPRLPVSRYPDEFWAYVDRNTRVSPQFSPQKFDDPFSAYADKTALEILGPRHAKSLLPQPQPQRPKGMLDLADVQANVVQGFRASHGVHLGVRFASAEDGRAFVAALNPGQESSATLTVTPGTPWKKGTQLQCVNIGFTFAGLQALGVPSELLQRFPRAYREGPFARAELLGDTVGSAPPKWGIAGLADGRTFDDTHAMVSLYVSGDVPFDSLERALKDLVTRHGATIVFAQQVDALPGENQVHFGYRDSISQPRIDGVPGHVAVKGEPALSPPGDFLLGADFQNSRGGYYIGELIPELAGNATYAAVRVIEQDVGAFEKLLAEVSDEYSKETPVSREMVAAKLMGRWPNGSPLEKYPGASKPSAKDENDFDYQNDLDGTRCPIGAHMRRMNPRGGMVLGVPWGRRVIRRGMPFGAAYQGDGDRQQRGLVGLFLCADLESQFEFLQRVWANKGLSAPGLRDTTDVFAGARTKDTQFLLTLPNGRTQPIPVPPLTSTLGSVYLLMPGMRGLQWIANAGWKSPVATRERPGPAASGPGPDPAFVDPAEAAFRVDPYRFYAGFRASAPVSRLIGSHDAYWVFSHELVTEVCDRKDIFLKPGKDRDQGVRPFSIAKQFGDGLFYMDPDRHTDVRALMDADFSAAIEGAKNFARQLAGDLLAPAVKSGAIELVSEFASQLPMRVFMDIMGIPAADVWMVDKWIRAALDSHDQQASLETKIAGGTATMALRSYFFALAKECPVRQTSSKATTLMVGMQKHSGCPISKTVMDPDEIMNTALNFGLGGYLSTEFLITTGVYNLVRNPEQWSKLRGDRRLLPNAVQEMLRYDAPFQMADRWVNLEKGKTFALGGVELVPGNKVTVVYGSANRDSTVFEDPDRFNIERPIDPRNFGFGHGIHYCIGAPLALAVAEEAITALLDRFAMPSLGEAGPWSSDPYFRSLKKVTLSLR